MARSWTFEPSDLVVDMRKPAGYEDLLGQEKLAAKHDYLSKTFGAQNFIFLGFENEYRGPATPHSIRVHTIYATFEVAHWPAQEVQKQERLTKERIAGLCPPTEAKSKKRRFEESHDDGELPVVHASTDEVHASNAKRLRLQVELEVECPARIGGNPKGALSRSGQSGQSFLERPSWSQSSSHVTSGGAGELGSHSKREIIAAGIAQPPTTLSDAVQKIELGSKADESVFARDERRNPTMLLQENRNILLVCGDRSTLGKEKGLLKIRHLNSQMSVIDQAANLQADRDELTLPRNTARPKSKRSSCLPQHTQSTQGYYKYTAGVHDRFLKTTTEACSGLSRETQKHEICVELQAQQRYIGELLFAQKDSRSLSEDARRTMVNATLTQLLVGFEKVWTASHPEVTIPAVGNVLDRQIRYLTLDIAIKCGDIDDLDNSDLLMHITAVQREAMSRQLVVLRAITENLRLKARSKRPKVASVWGQKTKSLPSLSPPLKQVLLIGDGSFKHTKQNPALVIDELTGVASVKRAGDPGEDADDGSSRGPHMKTLKRKQGTETSTSHARHGKMNAQEDDPRGTSQNQFEGSQSQDTARYGGNRDLQCYLAELLDQEEAAIEPHGTMTPANLRKTAPVLPSITSASEPVRNAPVPNERGFADVTEAFKAHDYNIVSEEERTEDLSRHRQANRALLGERSPVRDAGTESEGADDFFYATLVEFDSFGFEDELAIPNDAAPHLDLDSGGLWKL